MMISMPARLDAPATARLRRRTWPALGLASLLAVAGCGGSDEPTAAAFDVSAPATSTTAAAVSTTTAAADTTITTSTTTSTTATTTTPTLPAEVPLPQPIAPPTDIYAEEPIIEMGTLAIPTIDVEMTMYEGIRLTTLDHGPGHWPGSAVPGQTGNLVVGGHRTSSHRVFRNIDQLEPGDEIIFRDDTGEYTYAVDRVEIVDPSAIWIIEPTTTPTATLFACHPPGSTSERIVVFADLVASSEG
jgi:sortase A